MSGLGIALFLALATVWDVATRKIPNALNAAGAVLGLAFHLWRQGWSGLANSLAGFAAGFAVVLLLYLAGAVGAGDVKLFAALGAWVGAAGVLYCAMYSILYGGLIGIVVLLTAGQFGGWLRGLVYRCWMLAVYRSAAAAASAPLRSETCHRIPFMLAVVPGVITAHL